MSSFILFTLESFFPSHRAGTEVYVLNLCRYFIKQGWKVSVLISSSTGQKDYEFEGIPVYTFAVPERPLAEELNGLIPPRGLEDFIVKLNDQEPDWVHFHSFGRAINSYHLKAAKELGYKTAFTPHLGSFFCIKGNVRLFSTENCDARINAGRCTACFIHDKGQSKPISKVLGTGIASLTRNKSLKSLLPAAWYQAKHRQQEMLRVAEYTDIVFAIAPWIQRAFEVNGYSKSILIPQGISPVFFKYLKAQHKPIDTPIHLIFVGRMHPSKGVHLLKKAWDQLNKTEKVHMHIITNPSGGETHYFQSHKTWAKQQDSVSWNEGLSQNEVATYFNQMDVLVLPSISNEVAPLVILEAATRRIPVIASDYIAMKDQVTHGLNGWLFPNGDSDALKGVLEQIISQPQLILQAASKVERPKSMEEVAALVEQQFKDYH